MKSFYWVIADCLAGRPGPMREPWDLDELWDDGFRAIVSLSDEVDQEAIAAAGFHHGQFYYPAVLPVTPSLVDRFLELMDEATRFIRAQLAEGRPTLVHCHAGKDRTGALLAGYLIRYRDLSVGEAVRRVQEANPRAMSAPGFERLPELFAARDGSEGPGGA